MKKKLSFSFLDILKILMIIKEGKLAMKIQSLFPLTRD